MQKSQFEAEGELRSDMISGAKNFRSGLESGRVQLKAVDNESVTQKASGYFATIVVYYPAKLKKLRVRKKFILPDPASLTQTEFCRFHRGHTAPLEFQAH